MVKSKIRYLLVLLVFIPCIMNFVSAQDQPVLKLTVTQSPLDVYPPIMIYTAQFSADIILPAMYLMKVDFYNSSADSTANNPEYLGFAMPDKDGKFVLSKQMKPGVYVAVAKFAAGSTIFWSNKVQYKVY